MRTVLALTIAALASAAHAQSPSYPANVSAFLSGYNAPTIPPPLPNLGTLYGPGSAPSAPNVPDQTTVVSAPSLTVSERYERPPVSTALAAPLAFSQGTCFVSASGGGQGVSFGLSLALPIEDKGCTMRAMAQTLNALGERDAALRYLAAHDAGVRAALEAGK